MKKTLTLASVVLLLAAVVTLQSCKKKEKEGTYLLEYPVSFTAPAHTDNSEFNLVDTMLTSKLASAMSGYGLSLDNVKSVKLHELTLSLDPAEIAAGKNFNPYQYANAQIRTTAANEAQVAFITTVPQGVTSLTFESQYAEWVDYLKQNEFNVRVKAYHETDVPATNYTMKISFDVVYAE